MDLTADIKAKQSADTSLAYHQYGSDDFECMAEALNVKGIDAAKVAEYKPAFDEASRWRVSMANGRHLVPSNKVTQQLRSIVNSADRLARQAYTLCIARGYEIDLEKFDDIEPVSRPSPKRYLQTIETLLDRLGVTLETAADGIPDDHVCAHLQCLSTDVVDSYEREKELQKLIDTIVDKNSNPHVVMKAAHNLAYRARQGARSVQELRKMMVRPGHRGDAADSVLIDDMLNIYEKITGKSAGTSTYALAGEKIGKPRGPLIGFLDAASKPLHLKLTNAAWKSRIRTAKRARAQKKLDLELL